jgi:FtsP/CotA-like multicopper oxidase with cupredoxin domain
MFLRKISTVIVRFVALMATVFLVVQTGSAYANVLVNSDSDKTSDTRGFYGGEVGLQLTANDDSIDIDATGTKKKEPRKFHANTAGRAYQNREDELPSGSRSSKDRKRSLSRKPDNPFHFVLGGLFPTDIILSRSLRQTGNTIVRSSRPKKLVADLRIATDPVDIPGVNSFIQDWLIPQLDSVDTNSPPKVRTSWVQMYSTVKNQWSGTPRNNSMSDLVQIGYIGPGADQRATNNAFWNANGSTSDKLFTEIQNEENYNIDALWGKYDPANTVLHSTFDEDALRQNIANLDDPLLNSNPDLWYPSILYTFQHADIQGKGNLTGPVLIIQPGDDVILNFTNDIRIGTLTEEEIEQATLVANSTYGNSSSGGLAGNTSSNFHLHGSHTNPTAFGDNVVARYTAGQSWTTNIEIPRDHGVGSYWYHTHYHPSVNQQVYGGLSGFMQIGDPLARIPLLRDIPRNLGILKLSQIGSANGGKDIRLTGYDNIGVAVNRLTMVTVNGQFQPEADAGKGGWQALTLSNQTNNAQYQISLVHTDKNGQRNTLELFQFGQDGHQFPQILDVKGVLGQNSQNFGSGELAPPTAYAQTEDVISLAPGKRVDVLFYLPKGTTGLVSTYSFTDRSTGEEFFVRNAGRYPELSNANTDATGGNASKNPAGLTGFGALATFVVDYPVRELSPAQQHAFIQRVNGTVKVQEIQPDTTADEYDPKAVPRINLFATDDGQEIWRPIRSRSFSFSRTLVGPESEWDAPTQAQIQAYEEQSGNEFKRYDVLPIALNGNQFSDFPTWLGYPGPWLINDHVFPRGNLSIAQLGTIEEWDLKNWSVSRINALRSTVTPSQYIGHPYHIHINDFQVKDSDTELNNVGSLQDVIMLNSSGYNFYDTVLNKRVALQPLAGNFESIPEALDPDTVGGLGTWGANSQTIRMLFQDYVGTYVFHCHILPHEDAGMMQVLTVIENTESSWLAPSEGFTVTNRRKTVQYFTVYQAQGLQPFDVRIKTQSPAVDLKRLDVGNINSGFTQDLLIGSSGDGLVRVVDGASILEMKRGKRHGRRFGDVIARFRPYESSTLAPYAFAEDFTGDNQRDIVTAGFPNPSQDKVFESEDRALAARLGSRGEEKVDLEDFTITGWLGSNDGRKWSRSTFNLTPYNSDSDGALPISGKTNSEYPSQYNVTPVQELKASQFSITIGDFNLDNFNDYAMAYATRTGFRVTILDGAAAALLFSTGQSEGGFFPNESVLADALVIDSSLERLSSITLNSGFNSFYQSAIENLVASVVTETGELQQLTFQLDAGHFIATSEPNNPGGSGSASSHQAHGGTTTFPHDDKVINLINPSSTPLHLSDIAVNPINAKPSTPGFASVFGNGALVIGDHLLLAQGNSTNGNASTSTNLFDTAQQLAIDLNGLRRVDSDDIAGYNQSSFNPEDIQERNNVANLTFAAYFGRLPNPGGAATAAASLSSVASIQDFVSEFVSSPEAEGQIVRHFGSSLEAANVAKIVAVTYKTLYANRATERDIRFWQTQVDIDGLTKTFLPMAILQSTDRKNLFRLEFISSAAQFSNVQWGNDAVLLGSFGQGLVGQSTRFVEVNKQVFGIQARGFFTREAAQIAFDHYSDFTVKLLAGTKVSETGFF